MYKRRTKKGLSRKNKTRKNRSTRRSQKGGYGLYRKDDTDAFNYIKSIAPIQSNDEYMIVIMNAMVPLTNEEEIRIVPFHERNVIVFMYPQEQKASIYYYYKRHRDGTKNTEDLERIKNYKGKKFIFSISLNHDLSVLLKQQRPIIKETTLPETESASVLSPPLLSEEVESIPIKMPEIVQTPNPKKRPLSP